MSDRIDELAKRAVDVRLDGWERGQAVAELATIARENAAEADKWRKVAEAAYYLLNSDQCVHGDGAWRGDGCRVCTLRRAFDALPEGSVDHLASMTYDEYSATVEQEEAE